MKSILVISNEKDVLHAIFSCFKSKYRIVNVSSKEEALEMLQKSRSDYIFVDLEILRKSLTLNSGYKEALQPFWQLYPSIEIVIMSAPEMIRETVRAVKAGASDYIFYPINPEELNYLTEEIQESLIVQSELKYLRDQLWQSDSQEMVQTRDSRMQKVFDKIRAVAPTKSTVLLVGETGVGKGVFARLIHRHSNRQDGQFISVHCGAIPDTLIESELFGHEKGAFTGAVRRKLGKFEIAQGGTIFLDEIGTITHSAQIKLLQVLQDATFQRIGGEETIEANVRVISATNTNLNEMCVDGRFRRDLYYRLNVFPIEIPPLRERLEDLSLFVEVFLKKLNKLFSKKILGVHPDVMKAFESYAWPGNIRELENLLERAHILEPTQILTPESFPNELFELESPFATLTMDPSVTLTEVRRKGIDEIERIYLKELLNKNSGKIKESAEVAGISTRQLHKLMKKHGLRKEDFKSRAAPEI